MKSIEKMEPYGVTDISIRLRTILDRYNTELLQKADGGTKARPLNLYILTDGVWQPYCDAETPIKRLVRTLLQLKLDRAQVGIQFIRFGEDEEGILRMEKLY